MRAVVAQAVDITNQGLALLYKLGTGQDPKQSAQVRGCGRVAGRALPATASARWGGTGTPPSGSRQRFRGHDRRAWPCTWSPRLAAGSPSSHCPTWVRRPRVACAHGRLGA